MNKSWMYAVGAVLVLVVLLTVRAFRGTHPNDSPAPRIRPLPIRFHPEGAPFRLPPERRPISGATPTKGNARTTAGQLGGLKVYNRLLSTDEVADLVGEPSAGN